MGDDLVLAALFLAYADNSTVLFSQAQTWWDTYKLTVTGDLSWDNKAPALPILFSQLLTLKPDLGTGSDLSKWKKQAELALDSVVAANGPGYLTPGGLIWYDGSSDFCSLVPALNAAMLLIRYAPLANSSTKTNDYMVLRSLIHINLVLTCISRRLQGLNWITLWETTPCKVCGYLSVELCSCLTITLFSAVCRRDQSQLTSKSTLGASEWWHRHRPY